MTVNDRIQEILAAEKERIEELDKEKSKSMYETSPSSFRKIRQDGLRKNSIEELEALASRSNFADKDVLQVIFEAYMGIATKYAKEEKNE